MIVHRTNHNICELYFSDDCKACECPGNVIDGDVNVFASTCQLLPDGRPQCINCTEGHDGLNCEYCIEGFYGVPIDPEVRHKHTLEATACHWTHTTSLQWLFIQNHEMVD